MPSAPVALFDPNSPVGEGDDLASLLESIDPDTLKQLIALGSAEDKDALREKQRQQVDMLRMDPGQHSTPIGAALGGLGGVIGNAHAYAGQKALNEQQAQQIQNQQDGRMSFTQAQIDALRKRRGNAFSNITSPGGGVIAPGVGGGL